MIGFRRLLRMIFTRPATTPTESTVTPPEEHAAAEETVQKLQADVPRAEQIVEGYRKMGRAFRR